MSDNIPFDIQMEIIKRVPDVKSLIRFRAVSFIDSSEFITGYGARDTQQHRLLLSYKKAGAPYPLKYVTFVDAENDILTQQDFASNVPDLLQQLKYSKVIGSSCGLWCSQGYNSWGTEMVVIWNPSIRKSVGIVLPCNTSEKITRFGFGVCPSTYDPTIVGMSWYWRNQTWQVGIFTLSSKTWKMIPTSNRPHESITLRSSTQVAADRFIFWVAYDRIAANHSKDLILAFDLITHEFKEVNLPDSIANISVYPFISKLNESLVVSKYTNEVNGRVYGLWMMGEEGGVMTSFTKLFNINTPYSAIRTLLGFRKSGEPILETVTEDEQFAALEVYEPCSEHISNLGIYGENYSFFICPYKETLLLADHSGCCTISTIIEGENDGYVARCGARNNKFWKHTIT